MLIARNSMLFGKFNTAKWPRKMLSNSSPLLKWGFYFAVFISRYQYGHQAIACYHGDRMKCGCDIVCFKRKEHQNMSQNIHAIKKSCFGLRVFPSFTNSRHKGYKIHAHCDDDRHGRVFCNNPRNETKKCNYEEYRIDMIDFFEAVLQREKENNYGKYLRCSCGYRSNASTFCYLSKKYRA